MSDFRKPGSLFWPLLLVVVGVFLFLVNIGTIEGTVWENILKYWPVLLIILGVNGLYKRETWVGTILILGLGTILLLGNLGYLPLDAWELLFRIWPVLLIGFGLDIAFRKGDSTWNAILRVGIGLLLVGGILWVVLTSPFGAGVKQVTYSQQLEGATKAQVSFSVPVGKLVLTRGTDDLLVSGTAQLPRNVDLGSSYEEPVNGRSRLTLDWTSHFSFPMSWNAYSWDFKLNPVVPLDLQTNFGVGEMKADLSTLRLDIYKAKIGIGKAVIDLPCDQDAVINLEMGIGDFELNIPQGCDVNINMETGLVSHDLPVSYLKTNNIVRNENASPDSPVLEVKINLGIGQVRIQETE